MFVDIWHLETLGKHIQSFKKNQVNNGGAFQTVFHGGDIYLF